jgi:hypothetical protein
MENIRKTIEYTPSSIHLMDRQGDALARFIQYKNQHLEGEDFFILQNFICPDWLVHVLNVDNPDPSKFFYERYDDRCAYQGGKDLTGLTIEEIRDPVYLVDSLELYCAVRASGKPRFTKETVSIEPVRSFLRYVVPFTYSDDDKRMLVCCRYQDIESENHFPNKSMSA